jgi:hypothetical protein
VGGEESGLDLRVAGDLRAMAVNPGEVDHLVVGLGLGLGLGLGAVGHLVVGLGLGLGLGLGEVGHLVVGPVGVVAVPGLDLRP